MSDFFRETAGFIATEEFIATEDFCSNKSCSPSEEILIFESIGAPSDSSSAVILEVGWGGSIMAGVVAGWLGW